MKVVAVELCYQANGLRQIGDVFDLPGNPKKISKALRKFDGESDTENKGKGPEVPVKEPTKAEIMTQLSAAGVVFDPKANKPELLELLKAEIAKVAPGSKVDPGETE